MAETFTLPKLLSRDGMIQRIGAFIAKLPIDKAWRVTIEQAQSKRSTQQNRYLWGVCYPAIAKHLPGWTSEDIHEYCLGECFGWEELGGLGRKRVKPIRRSAKLSVTDFMDYVAWIQQDMAGRGIYVPDPNEEAHEPA